jgi:hypothetical protein
MVTATAAPAMVPALRREETEAILLFMAYFPSLGIGPGGPLKPDNGKICRDDHLATTFPDHEKLVMSESW